MISSDSLCFFMLLYLSQDRDESQVSLLKNILLLLFEHVRSSPEAITLGKCVTRMKNLIIYRMKFRTGMMAVHTFSICFRTNLAKKYESLFLNINRNTLLSPEL